MPSIFKNQGNNFGPIVSEVGPGHCHEENQGNQEELLRHHPNRKWGKHPVLKERSIFYAFPLF